MRLAIPFAAIALATAPLSSLFAAPASPPPLPPAATAAAPSSGTAVTGRPSGTRTRQSLADRFENANTAKDGHLTKEQAATARWTYVTRNFDAIDKDHRGFITADDIRGYARERRAERAQQRAAQPATHS
jgi:hypothetical protein